MNTLEATNRPNAVSYLQATVDVLRNNVSMLKGENERLTKDIDVYVVEVAERDEQIEHLSGMLLDLRTVNEELDAESKRLYEERGY